VDKNLLHFFELLRAGLWDKEIRLPQYNSIDYSFIFQLAEEQSVVGLVTAGLEHVTDENVPLGHKQRRDYSGMLYMMRKFVSFWGSLSDILRHFSIFPKDSIVFFGGVLRSGLYAAVRGE